MSIAETIQQDEPLPPTLHLMENIGEADDPELVESDQTITIVTGSSNTYTQPESTNHDPLPRRSKLASAMLRISADEGITREDTVKQRIGDLVDIAQSDDRDAAKEAFSEIVKLTYNRFYALARSLARNDTDAADILSEAYRRAYEGLGGFEQTAEFTTWMHRIVVNCFKNFRGMLRGRRYESLTDFSAYSVVIQKSIAQSEHDPYAAISPEEDPNLGLIREYLDLLPPKMHSAVTLHYVHKKSHPQIAAMLGISESSSKISAFRGLTMLKEYMTGERLTPTQERALFNKQLWNSLEREDISREQYILLEKTLIEDIDTHTLAKDMGLSHRKLRATIVEAKKAAGFTVKPKSKKTSATDIS